MSGESSPVGATTAPTVMTVTRLHAVIRGRVQGVGFRYWMHHTAEGNVETELESADRGLLEAILHDMHQGPSGAHVEQVAADWETDVAPRYTGAFRVA